VFRTISGRSFPAPWRLSPLSACTCSSAAAIPGAGQYQGNQPAQPGSHLRLLDEMGSLAEGDLTVKATVTEEITGAIADSINFAIEALRSWCRPSTKPPCRWPPRLRKPRQPRCTWRKRRNTRRSRSPRRRRNQGRSHQHRPGFAQLGRVGGRGHRSVQIAAKGAEVVRQTIQGMDNIREPDSGNLEANQAPRRKLAGNRLDRGTD